MFWKKGPKEKPEQFFRIPKTTVNFFFFFVLKILGNNRFGKREIQNLLFLGVKNQSPYVFFGKAKRPLGWGGSPPPPFFLAKRTFF